MLILPHCKALGLRLFAVATSGLLKTLQSVAFITAIFE